MIKKPGSPPSSDNPMVMVSGHPHPYGKGWKHIWFNDQNKFKFMYKNQTMDFRITHGARISDPTKGAKFGRLGYIYISPGSLEVQRPS